MSKHTPGPWTAVNQTTSTLLKQDGPQGRYLFHLKEYPGIPESEANARLIAAAPDLLAALKEIIAGAKRGFPGCTAALEAIAKAEGTPGPWTAAS